VASFLSEAERRLGVRAGVRRIFKRGQVKRYKRLLVTRIDRLWRRLSGKDDLLYFHVSYRSRDAKREYTEYGVLSARTIREAARKAELARKVFEEPGCEEYCDYKTMIPISIRGYRLMKNRLFDIDSFFDKKGNLRV
jgi:hypothetical protein